MKIVVSLFILVTICISGTILIWKAMNECFQELN